MALKVEKARFQEEYTYIPVSERNEQKPFSVKFKRLPLGQVAEISDNAISVSPSGTYTFNSNMQALVVLQKSLVSWENITEGKKVIQLTKEHGVIAEESLLLLPEDLRTEISLVVMAVSRDPNRADELLTGEIPDTEQEDAVEEK